MCALETSMGGGQEDFPATTWSSIHAGETARREEKLAGLCNRYWRPVYKYIRTSKRRTVEDAKDLTQGFFCHVLLTDAVLNYAKEKGRFRAFLKGVLKNFLAEKTRKQYALKRGGKDVIVNLEVAALENVAPASGERPLTPEEEFDRQWAKDVHRQAQQATKVALEKAGRERCWNVFCAYEIEPGDDEKPTYVQLAETFGMTKPQVKHDLEDARLILHKQIREILMDSVANPEELKSELYSLFR